MPNTPHTPPPPDWFEDTFGDLYNVVYSHRTVEAAKREAGFAARALDLKPGQRLLDLCCGNGRHLLHLSRITPNAVGLDYSLALLSHSRRLLGRAARVVRADMRAIPFYGAFDALTNFFTSFGYFQDDGEDLLVAREVARALRPGGRFFIDYANPAYVRSTLQAESTRTTAGYEIRECRWIDGHTKRINKATQILRDGKVVQTLGESVRLYDEAEFRELLEDAGLACNAVFGDYDGAPMSPRAPRMIITGSKCPRAI